MQLLQVVLLFIYTIRLDGLNKDLDPWYEISVFYFSFLFSSRHSRQGYPVLHGRIQSSLC